jgi:transposase
MTSKIMALMDALGNLIDFRLLPGQAHDLRNTAALIDGLSCGHLLAHRAFDANWLREALSEAKIGVRTHTSAQRYCLYKTQTR